MKFRMLVVAALLIAASRFPPVSDAVSSAWKTLTKASATPAGERLAGQRTAAESYTAGTNRDRRGNPVEQVTAKAAEMPIEGIPIRDIGEVLRMDITAPWVYSHWSRKTTALADLNLHGVRVPLVTGTEVDDLAGSLTYYFNSAGQVQRIVFRGRTGDTRKLVSLVISKFGLRLQSPEIAGEQLYQVIWNGKPMSELRIRPASVMWANTPHTSFDVFLNLERPGSGRFMRQRRSPAVSRADRATRRR